MDLVIDRTKWLRGEGDSKSRLLREHDGKMCCMGFYGLAKGLLREDMLNRLALPFNLEQEFDDIIDIYKTNDNSYKSGHVREVELTEKLAKNGINVTFVN